jgi:hypothetical protein
MPDDNQQSPRLIIEYEKETGHFMILIEGWFTEAEVKEVLANGRIVIGGPG